MKVRAVSVRMPQLLPNPLPNTSVLRAQESFVAYCWWQPKPMCPWSWVTCSSHEFRRWVEYLLVKQLPTMQDLLRTLVGYSLNGVIPISRLSCHLICGWLLEVAGSVVLQARNVKLPGLNRASFVVELTVNVMATLFPSSSWISNVEAAAALFFISLWLPFVLFNLVFFYCWFFFYH